MSVEISKNKLNLMVWLCRKALDEDFVYGKKRKEVEKLERFVQGLITEKDAPKLNPFVRERAKDDLKKLLFLPPYNEMTNICAGDGIFARSLEEKYGLSIDELKKECGL